MSRFFLINLRQVSDLRKGFPENGLVIYVERTSVVKGLGEPCRSSFHAHVTCLHVFGSRTCQFPHDVFFHRLRAHNIAHIFIEWKSSFCITRITIIGLEDYQSLVQDQWDQDQCSSIIFKLLINFVNQYPTLHLLV